MTIDEKIIITEREINRTDRTLGYLRYEVLRRVSPRQLAALHIRNVNGEKFDDMIDAMIEGKDEPRAVLIPRDLNVPTPPRPPPVQPSK